MNDKIDDNGPSAYLQRFIDRNSWGVQWVFECTCCKKFYELHPTDPRCRWRPIRSGLGTQCANRDAQTESLLRLIQQAQCELARRWAGTAYVLRVPDSKNAPAILLESWWW